MQLLRIEIRDEVQVKKGMKQRKGATPSLKYIGIALGVYWYGNFGRLYGGQLQILAPCKMSVIIKGKNIVLHSIVQPTTWHEYCDTDANDCFTL